MMEKRSRSTSILKLLTAILTVAAVVKELRTPSSRRTWHGKVAGFVPYDFRPPTLERVRQTFWDPQGSLLVGQVFGVGWTINAGALKNLLRRS